MTLEEKFNKQIGFILEQIKEKQLYSKKGSIIQYWVAPFGHFDPYISSENEEAIIGKLEEWGGIKILKKVITPGIFYGKDKLFYLHILQPQFDNLYRKYQFEVLPKKEIPKAVERVKRGTEKTNNNALIPFKLPPNTIWEDIELDFENEYDVDIYIKGKFFKKSNNEKMGFFKSGTKDKKPDIQWHFLFLLSVVKEMNEREATKDKMSLSLGKRFNKKISGNNCEQIKSKLSKKLQEDFGMSDEPFYPYKDHGYYKPKFKLKPIPTLRGSGEPYMTKGGSYNDNIKYEGSESETF